MGKLLSKSDRRTQSFQLRSFKNESPHNQQQQIPQPPTEELNDMFEAFLVRI